MKDRCCRTRHKTRPKLIKQWKQSWKLTSVQAAALLMQLNIINVELLPLFHFAIPTQTMSWINALLGTSIIILRLIVQPSMNIKGEMPDE
jgi:hypothetical protein